MELRRLASALVTVTIVLVTLASCGRESDEADEAYVTTPAISHRPRPAEALGYTVDDAVEGLGLTVFPLTAQANTDETAYRTLEEAISLSKIEIRELPEAVVSRVKVTNRGEKPVYVLAGEVLAGGRQDRVVALDSVIAPESETEIAVLCVEQSRWAGRSLLKGSYGLASSAVRLVCQSAEGGGQEAMWAVVDDACAALEEGAVSGSYRETVEARQVDEQALAALCQSVTGLAHVRGIAVVAGGTLVGIEAFANPELFAALLPQVLRSCASEAVPAGGSALTKREIAEILQLADDSGAESLKLRRSTGLSMLERKSTDQSRRAFIYGVPDSEAAIDATSALHISILPL